MLHKYQSVVAGATIAVGTAVAFFGYKLVGPLSSSPVPLLAVSRRTLLWTPPSRTTTSASRGRHRHPLAVALVAGIVSCGCARSVSLWPVRPEEPSRPSC